MMNWLVLSIENGRNKKRHDLYNSHDEIDKKRDTLMGQIEKQMEDTSYRAEEVFRIRWRLEGRE